MLMFQLARLNRTQKYSTFLCLCLRQFREGRTKNKLTLFDMKNTIYFVWNLQTLSLAIASYYYCTKSRTLSNNFRMCSTTQLFLYDEDYWSCKSCTSVFATSPLQHVWCNVLMLRVKLQYMVNIFSHLLLQGTNKNSNPVDTIHRNVSTDGPYMKTSSQKLTTGGPCIKTFYRKGPGGSYMRPFFKTWTD